MYGIAVRHSRKVIVGQVPNHHILGHYPYLTATARDLVCSVDLVDLVHLVSFIQAKNQTNQINKTNQRDQINQLKGGSRSSGSRGAGAPVAFTLSQPGGGSGWVCPRIKSPLGSQT